MTTISDIIRDRAERGLADLLLSLYDAGYCAGAGLHCDQANAGLRDLIATITARHQAEIVALREWADPPAGELPVWLRAARERSAIEQTPPDGWGTLPEGWPV